MLTRYLSEKEFKELPSLQLIKELDDLRISTGDPVFIKNNDFNSADIKNKFYGEYPYDSDKKEAYADVSVYGKDNKNYISSDLLHTPDPDLATRIVTIALMQVGFKEGKNNDNPFGKFFNLNNASWCSFFVHWALVKAGAVKKEDLKYSFGSARKTFANILPHTLTKNPEEFNVGDLIIWGKINSWQGHIGLIIANDIDNKTIYTVEGNISNKVKIKKYNYDKIAYGKYEFLGVGNTHGTSMKVLKPEEVFALHEGIEKNNGESTR